MEKNLRARKALGAENASLPVPRHFNNGNEARYPSKIGSDTRGLPHDAHGEVDLNAWGTLLRDLDTQGPADFENVVLGGPRKLVQPLAIATRDAPRPSSMSTILDTGPL